jgi:hypothetical protein
VSRKRNPSPVAADGFLNAGLRGGGRHSRLSSAAHRRRASPQRVNFGPRMLGYPGRPRRSGRVAEGGALLRRYGGECLHRGFESLLLRLDVGEPKVQHGGTPGSPVGPLLLRRERRMPHSRCGGSAVPPPRPGAQSTQEVGSATRGRRSRPSVPCQPFGGVAERSNAAVSKTVSGLWVRRGFKSLPLRLIRRNSLRPTPAARALVA